MTPEPDRFWNVTVLVTSFAFYGGGIVAFIHGSDWGLPLWLTAFVLLQFMKRS